MRRVGVRKRKAKPSKRIRLAQAMVASAYGVALGDMRTRTRRHRAQEARQVAAYLARVVFEIGLRELARETGRSPGTAVHACQQVERRRDQPDFDRRLETLERRLRAAARVSL